MPRSLGLDLHCSIWNDSFAEHGTERHTIPFLGMATLWRNGWGNSHLLPCNYFPYPAHILCVLMEACMFHIPGHPRIWSPSRTTSASTSSTSLQKYSNIIIAVLLPVAIVVQLLLLHGGTAKYDLWGGIECCPSRCRLPSFVHLCKHRTKHRINIHEILCLRFDSRNLRLP